MKRAFAAALMFGVLPIAASAQTPPAAAPASQGPMIVERIHSGFLVAPDVKVTEVDKKTSELVGGYAGWVTDATFLIGGGRATLSSPLAEILVRGGNSRRRIDQGDLRRAPITNANVRFREDFLVAEPEVDALVRLTKHLRLTVGAGYRFTGGEGRDDTRLRGAVGSLGLQIGGGS